MIECSCSCGFREKPLEETLVILDQLGFQYFEGTADLPCHLYPYVRGLRPVAELKDILAATPVKIVCIGGDSDFAVNDESWPEQAMLIRSEIDLAVELGIDLIRVFVSHIPAKYVTEGVWRRVIKNMRSILPYAEDKGVRLAVENHFGITGKPDDLIRVLESVNSPALGLNLDPANFVPCSEDPAEATRILAPYTIYTHMKDCIRDENGPYNGYDFVDIGAGLVDFTAILRTLKQNGYAGYLSIEYENTTDVERGTADSLRRLREIMASLNVPSACSQETDERGYDDVR